MALTAYQTLTGALLQAPSSSVPLVSTAVLTSYNNIARSQVAADGECVRFPAVLTTAARSFSFSSIVTSPATGFGPVIAIRSAKIGTNLPIDIRPWEWFAAYYGGSTAVGRPLRAAQQGQGVNGTFFLDPATPAVTISFDTVCLPIPLVDDVTPEAIPQLWTDAVPFYAAWYGMMSLQRQGDANLMMERYRDQMRRARQISTPSELPENLPGGIGAQMAAAHGPLTGAAPAAAGQR